MSYGAPISLENAKKVAAAALAEVRKNNWTMAVAVVDAAGDGAPTGLRLLNRMLFELYHDQINIVRANLEGSRRSLLFTAGDGAKRLVAES